MTRKLFPFRRADGLHELTILGNFGLAHAYNSTEKVTHYVEDTDVSRDTIHSDSYYIQLDGNHTNAAYKSKGVHLLRDINVGEETATYEFFAASHDRDDEEDWIKEECPASDFPHLLDQEKLIPMKKVSDNK